MQLHAIILPKKISLFWSSTVEQCYDNEDTDNNVQ